MSTWKKILFVAFLLLGIAGFCAIPFIVDVDETISTIRSVGWPCLAAYLLTAGAVLLFPALAWWILMRSEGIPAGLGQAIKATAMGAPLNFFTPSAYLGGEPLKMYYIAREAGVTKRRVLATIIAAKVQEVAALLLVMVAAAVFFVGKQDMMGRRNEILLTAAMLVVAGIWAFLMVGFYRDWRPTVKFVNLLARFGVAKRRLARLRSWCEDMERIIHALLTQRWRAALVSQVVVFLSAISILVRPYVFFAFAGHIPTLRLEDVCMIYVIVNFINTITIIPGSLGLLEGGVVGFFAARGLGDHNGAALMIMNRAADVFFVSLGIWLIAHYGLTSVAKGVAKGEEKIEEKDVRDAAEAEEKGGVTRPPGKL